MTTTFVRQLKESDEASEGMAYPEVSHGTDLGASPKLRIIGLALIIGSNVDSRLHWPGRSFSSIAVPERGGPIG